MKTLVALAALTVVGTMLGFAQITSAYGTATFEVTTGITVECVNDGMVIGQLAPGTTYQIAADGQMTPPPASGDPNTDDGTPLYWAVYSEGGGTAQVTFTLPAFFVGETFGARIPYSVTPTSAGYFDTDNEPAVGVQYEPFDPRVPKSIYLPVDGSEAFIGIGGVLALPPGTPVDNYIGTFILTAGFVGM